ncbi:hypothetical protein ACVM3D_001524 [Campylobacter upsaliensis]|nr:hypothetical protein [Campylobacter upsaliensis]EAH9147380.1 hypothetical protein [Campylobacter upsaliensis]
MKKSFYQEFKDKTKQSLTRLRLEKRGIYNVSFNEKRASEIDLKRELELVEEAIIKEMVYYVKGWHSKQRDKGRGAEHIKLHLEKGSEGEISLEELLNLGNSMRAYLKIFKEPFIDEKGAKIYEWENDENVRFRVVTDKRADISPCDNCTATYTLTNQGTNATSIAETIITFYSDRNLNEKMEFKNPKVKEFYENKEKSKNSQNISKLGLKK